jgi:hypothetical protein
VFLERRARPPSATALACILGLAAALGLAGCESDTTGVPLPPPQLRVDDAPAWSHDGTRIAFARRVASSLGPRGLYVMDWPGGTPVLVREMITDATLGLGFTADDSWLIEQSSGFVALHPIAGGTSDSWGTGLDGPSEPDASHDGTTIAYVGLHATRAAIKFRHPVSHVDTVVMAGGLPLFGTHPRFSPGDSLVAYVGDDGVFLWRRATGQRLRLTNASGPPSTQFAPRWLDSSRILFDQRVGTGALRSFIIDRTTGAVVEVPPGLGGSEAISAGRDSVLIEEYDFSDPELSKIVLFVRGLTSPQSTMRQVTSYQPAPTTP